MTPPAVLPDEVRSRVEQWIVSDPSEHDREELGSLLARATGTIYDDPLGDASPVQETGASPDPAAIEELSARMGSTLHFGTAGLRGPLRAGPSAMNLAVVRRAAAGISSYLISTGKAGQVVIIGHDARHRSREFALDAARVLASAGFSALLAPGPLPTPITAFAVQHLHAAAALQVTASHNPPQDNGLKVYLAGGAQIVSPIDAEIEAAIEAAPAAVDVDVSVRPARWPDGLVQQYLDRVAALPRRKTRGIRIAATPMHGVGGGTLIEALGQAEFTDIQLVPAQAAPDPDFPTVAFPNPEEPGATDLLLTLADRINADIAIAVDPDADRCAIGVPDADGVWRMLRGDETGALLGERVLATLDRSGHPDPLVATTIVSSELLRSIAAAHDVRYDETLTGFKNIVRAGDGSGTGLVYGYEEALGHCVDPDVVRDKDGISAATLACDLAAELKAEGRTILDALDDLARAHGLHVTDQLSMRVTDLTVISDAMARLRAHLPTSLLGDAVTNVRDVLPATDAVIIRTARFRVVVRPSGTEPKLKCYLEVRLPLPADADAPTIATARSQAGADLATLRSEMQTVLGI